MSLAGRAPACATHSVSNSKREYSIYATYTMSRYALGGIYTWNFTFDRQCLTRDAIAYRLMAARRLMRAELAEDLAARRRWLGRC